MSTVMYAGTTEGVFTIEGDNGAWEIRSKGLGEWEVSDIAVVPGSSNKIVAGTRGDGVLVSEDAGKSWKKPNRGRSGPGKVKCVTISPHDLGRMVRGHGADRGLGHTGLRRALGEPRFALGYPLHRTDRLPRAPPSSPTYATSWSTHPTRIRSTLRFRSATWRRRWTAAGRGRWSTTTSTRTSTLSSRVPTTRGTCTFRRAVTTVVSDTSPGRALYETLDGGESWRPMAMEFEQEYSVPLAMHPLDPDVLYSALAFGPPPLWNREGGARSTLVRSNDGGASWHPANTGFEEVERDYVETITFDQSAPDHIYIGTRQGGVFTSRDAGESWSKVEVDLPEITELRVISTDEASG